VKNLIAIAFAPRHTDSMTRRFDGSSRAILLSAFWLCFSQFGSAAPLEIGLAAEDITPPVGWRMSGYFSERLSTGTHDPLQAKVLVLRQGPERAALVICDLIGVPASLTTPVRQRASQKTGIPTDHILIAATHTHTGPLYFGALREHFHRVAMARAGKDPYERIDYPAILAERLVDAVTRANRHLQPVQFGVTKAEVRGLAFNRRYHMKDGSVVFNPGKLNPNIVSPAGPIDPEAGVVFFQTADRSRPLACLTIFALHTDTVGGTDFGEDYPFHLERTLRQYVGRDLWSVFGLGTCGDINHLNVGDARAQKGQEEADRIGTALGEAVVRAFPTLEEAGRPALAARSTTVRVPLQQHSADQIAWARTNMMSVGTTNLPFLKQVEACKIMDLQWRDAASLSLEVQVFRLSADTALVGLPGEVFVELGLAIKKASPFKNTFVLELCNESLGYVPTRKAFAEGSYEVVNSRVQPGGGERLVEAAVGLLKELKR
jgi:hypothetical protein